MLRKAQWLRNPEPVVRAIFAQTGPLAAVVPRYRANPVQIDYAVCVAQTAIRGVTDRGRVTMVEAGAGIGKSLGYLIPGLIHAVLTGRRTMISTYTLHLQRQLIGEDGQVAASVVEQLTGVRPTFAARRARSQFASPSKCRLLAEAMRLAKSPKEADAMDDLANFAEAANARAALIKDKRDSAEDYIAAAEGLIDAWAEDNPDLHAMIADRDRELYALDISTGDAEQLQWQIYHERSLEANCLVTTHASTLIDMRLNGIVHRNDTNPFGLVVVDEADRLDDAAAAQFSMQTSLAAVKQDIEGIHLAARDDHDPDRRIDAVNAARDLDNAYVRLTSEIEAWTRMTQAHQRHANEVKGSEPWIGSLRSLSRVLAHTMAAVDRLQTSDAIDLTRVLTTRHAAIEQFLESVDSLTDRAPGSTDSSGGRTVPLVHVSRVRYNPSIASQHVNGPRIVARLWRGNRAQDARPTNVDAIFLTSATLSDPSATTGLTFRVFQNEVGLTFTPQLVNSDLCKVLEPESFGDPKFVLAHPDVPVKPRPDVDDHASQLKRWHAYLASIIREAALRPTKRGSSRIMVLVTAHGDAEAIAKLLHSDLGNRLLVRRVGKNGQVAKIGAYVDLLQKNDQGILISAGAWEGVSVKGVDHVIIAKLPFPSPSNDKSAFVRVGINNKMTIRMMRRLRQGLARGIRQATDAPTIWIADPRFGLPERVRVKYMLPNVSKDDYSAAIPSRFHDNLRKAKLFPTSI